MKRKKILIAPLDWGLGHATRCIPVIRELLIPGNDVLIAADGQAAALLRKEFPQLKIISLKGYGLRYSGIFPAWLKTFLLLPKIIFRMWKENSVLKKIIDEEKIDVVISDNRFGLWNKKICSVYITHQVMIKCPAGLKMFEPLLHFLHLRVIKKYDFCWIPDFRGTENLSGDLSHKYFPPENTFFVGPLSRFKFNEGRGKPEFDFCFVISGPEPSRSEFEKKIFRELNGLNENAIVILGQPENKRDEQRQNIRIVSHLASDEMEKIIQSSKVIICRAGYSGIMDLAVMKKDALLVPTSGQTEQEYLTEYLSSKKIFPFVSEKNFSLKNINYLKNFSVGNINLNEEPGSSLSEAIEKLMAC